MKRLKTLFAKATLRWAIVKEYTKLLGKTERKFVKRVVSGRCSEAELNQFKDMVKTAANR